MEILEEVIAIKTAKKNVGIEDIEKQLDNILKQIEQEEKEGRRPIKASIRMLALLRKRQRLYYKDLPKALKRMGYDPDEILTYPN